MQRFHELRSAFFPNVRSVESAHVTLFHHLPGKHRAAVLSGVAEAVARFRHPDIDPHDGAARVDVVSVFRLSKGVAYKLAPAFLQALRAPIRARFADWLKPQDARPWRNPHITIQNKADPEEAERLAEHLSARFEPCAIRVLGVQAWRYDYGPWKLLREFPFTVS